MKISFSKENHRHIGMSKVWNGTWEEYCKIMEKYYRRARLVSEGLRCTNKEEERDKTKGNFFVRGEIVWRDSHLTGGNVECGEGYWRCDKNLRSCEIIVLDIDKGEIEWETLCNALDSMECNYLVYTSYSYNPEEEKYKYRVIFPIKYPLVVSDSGYTLEDCKRLLSVITMNAWSRLSKLLGEEDKLIWQDENVRWSQEWYFGLTRIGGENDARYKYRIDAGSVGYVEEEDKGNREGNENYGDKERTNDKIHGKLKGGNNGRASENGGNEERYRKTTITANSIKEGEENEAKIIINDEQVGINNVEEYIAKGTASDEFNTREGEGRRNNISLEKSKAKLIKYARNIKNDSNGYVRKNNSTTIADQFRRIREGEDYHKMLNDVIWGKVKDGMDKHSVVEFAGELMSLVPTNCRDDRWEDRYNDIERSVNGAYNKVHMDKENISMENKKGNVIFSYNLNTDLVKSISSKEDDSESMESRCPLMRSKWPPGPLGELALWIYERQKYQNRVLAIISAFGIIDGMFARDYNISGMGLAKYWLLLAKTGFGKDQLHKFISKVLNCLGYGNRLGSSQFTGNKSLYMMLNVERCVICVNDEKGLFLKQRSGNPEGLRAFTLALFNRTGRDDYSPSQAFSKDSESILRLKSCNFSSIGESTHDALYSSLSEMNSVESGELGRTHLVDITGKKPYSNKSPLTKMMPGWEKTLPIGILQHKIGGYDDGKGGKHSKNKRPIRKHNNNDPFTIVIIDNEHEESGIRQLNDAHENMCVDMENMHIEHDIVLAAFHTRAHVKVLRMVGSIMAAQYGLFPLDDVKVEGNNGTDYAYIPMDKNAFRWAVKWAELEVEMLNKVKCNLVSSDIMEMKNIVKPVINKILLGMYKMHGACPPLGVRDMRMFTKSNLSVMLSKNASVQKLAKNPGSGTYTNRSMSGFKLLLDNLAANGLIRRVYEQEISNLGFDKRGEYYQITASYVYW